MVTSLALLPGCQSTLEKAIAHSEKRPPLEAPNKDGWTPGNDPCKVRVLNDYCLGGEIEDLLATRESSRQWSDDGLANYDFQEKYRITTVTVFQDKILSVGRNERPANWLVFHALMRRLDHRYGLGKDLSHFPEDAETPKARQNAIYGNRGEARYQWERDGWSITLVWDNMKTISLVFRDEGLSQEYAANLSGAP